MDYNQAFFSDNSKNQLYYKYNQASFSGQITKWARPWPVDPLWPSSPSIFNTKVYIFVNGTSRGVRPVRLIWTEYLDDN